MASRSDKALVGALEKADLLDAARHPKATQRVHELAGVLHAQYGCDEGRKLREHTGVLPWLDLLSNPRACQHQDCRRQRHNGSGADTVVAFVLRLLDASDNVRAARRYLADPTKTTVAGRREQLTRKLTSDREGIARLATWGYGDDFNAACARVLAGLDEALDLLTVKVVDPEVRAKVLDRVRRELIPAKYRARMKLEDTPTLMGVVSHFSTPRKVQEVLDVLNVGGSDTSPVLLGPRYAADYIQRFYSQGSAGGLLMLTVPAPDIPDDVVRVAAAMWAPENDGPLADLAAAVTSARDVTA